MMMAMMRYKGVTDRCLNQLMQLSDNCFSLIPISGACPCPAMPHDHSVDFTKTHLALNPKRELISWQTSTPNYTESEAIEN